MSDDARPTLHIFARWPEPGQAKTRLIPHFGKDGAAAIYRKLLAHTVETARASGLPFVVRVTGAEPARFREWLGHDAEVVDQGDGNLSDKLARMPAPGIALGSDCPGLTVDHLGEAAGALADHNACVGPASDGGYWALGLMRPMPWVFTGMEWSTDTVFDQTIQRLRTARASVAILPELSDVDLAEDLAAWPEFLP
ncbi:hypothetical protein HME9302_01689 [Alteripontixanthobacter maritimus]|uniref:2-phospho-L-lactate guanylyltransferase n=1 Tax=Alteripontixanthobacter maritimus TaxID=2161824 RepID=A0A369Q6I0_9SPHN|nr:TIGR04282 family arsenosugar biosynthesis glycosyltransferase [Alteripontixanthobacter maritimus]RDC60481.1 hypothetical protein HME9302_01689 [Alteripontixanthobacter maritimus]